MLTRKQFLILLLVAILSAACTSLLVIGVFSHDFTFAIVSFAMMVVVSANGVYFAAADTNKKRVGDVRIEGEIHPEFKE